LILCQKYKIDEAVAYLKEKVNKITEAIELLMNSFYDKIVLFSSENEFSQKNIPEICLITSRFLVNCLKICLRNQKIVQEKEDIEQYWLFLLDTLSKTYKKVSDNSGID
jgi:hypothetical protein